jgi:hypothetical protein
VLRDRRRRIRSSGRRSRTCRQVARRGRERARRFPALGGAGGVRCMLPRIRVLIVMAPCHDHGWPGLLWVSRLRPCGDDRGRTGGAGEWQERPQNFRRFRFPSPWCRLVLSPPGERRVAAHAAEHAPSPRTPR